jgi:hypothetical protein
MTTRVLRTLGLLVGFTAATACTDPVNCTLQLGTALTVSVRAPGGTQDLTQGTLVDATQNGTSLPQSAVQYPQGGAPIIIYGSGGAYRITLHHAAYRDTTVTANVATGDCGPVYPPLALTVVLTPM